MHRVTGSSAVCYDSRTPGMKVIWHEREGMRLGMARVLVVSQKFELLSVFNSACGLYALCYVFWPVFCIPFLSRYSGIPFAWRL